MAVVTRYFSTAAAGAGDGTSWANRAELLPSGNWSTVITGFNFSGSDSLLCLIGPGTHTCGETLAAGLFSNPPSAANSLFAVGCDTSGVPLVIPNPSWRSCQPAWDDSTLPVIATTTNVQTLLLASAVWRLVKFTASGRTGGGVIQSSLMHWCVIENSTNSVNTFCAVNTPLMDCVLSCTGAAYNMILSHTLTLPTSNCRLVGVAGSSGNRHGLAVVSNGSISIYGCTIVGVGGDGAVFTASSTGATIRLRSCVIANTGGSGFKSPSTAAQSSFFEAEHCIITGNGAYGVDAQSAGNIVLADNRLRDNTSGNFNGMGNYPTDLNNYITDSDDADDYVNAAAGDYRIRYGSPIWGKGFGVADAPPTAAEIAAAVWARGERTLTA